MHVIFFFFQAEDGIRDLTVTGVQTCALPISTFLGIRMLEEVSGAKFLHVPFKGIGNMMPSLLGGQLDFAFPEAAVALTHIRAGKLMPLAVIVRTNALPKVPTLAEAGFPGLEIYSSFSVAAPSATPPATVPPLSAEIIP